MLRADMFTMCTSNSPGGTPVKLPTFGKKSKRRSRSRLPSTKPSRRLCPDCKPTCRHKCRRCANRCAKMAYLCRVPLR